MFGLSRNDINEIIALLHQYEEVEQAFIFGSRAKGNFRTGSDVDIALKGKDLTFETVNQISSMLNEETLMPYRFDVINYHTISNQDLIEHIDRVGKLLYENTVTLEKR